MQRILTLFLMAAIAAAAVEPGVILVEKGGHAVIVTADSPLPVSVYAAQELVRHIAQASGMTLPVVTESTIPEGHTARIYLGPTKAAQAKGLDVTALPPETFIMRSEGSELYILGDEDKGDPLDESNSKCGTLFGVYELLERTVKVRWLWPGTLGTYIPKTDRIVLPATNETVTPRLAFREILWGYVHNTAIRKTQKLTESEQILSFSPEGLERYGYDLRDYLRRHRMGGVDRTPPVGHHFGGWWQKYGEQHPEWFMMNEDGTRGPTAQYADKTQVPMCVSNPELHRFIIEGWNGKDVIRLGEVDWPDACRCPACLAWDAPAPDPLPDFVISSTDLGQPNSAELHRHRGHVLAGFYEPMCTSDRYARFWQAVQRLAAERNPDAVVSTYIYYGYFPAPSPNIKLSRQFYGEFVPWGNPQHTDFFPMREEALEWIKLQWLGWQRTGIRLAYRPNYLHDGWIMPIVDTQQSGNFFRFAVENGMEGTRFDSLTGQWATQGPKLYVHMRLHIRPDLSVGEILDEYYGAFGPAAKEVRDYFGYWEKYCVDHLQLFNDLYIDHGHRWPRFQVLAHEAFPPACFEPAEQLLERAAAAAQTATEPEFALRVKFLRDGLRHAQLGVAVAACFDGARDIPEPSERFEKAVDAVRALVAFRRAHEEPHISDYLYGAAWREELFWTLRPIFDRLKKEQAIGTANTAQDMAADPTGKLP